MVQTKLMGVVVGVALAVTACGGGSETGAGGRDAGATRGGEPKKISYALWNPDQAPVTEELVAEFEKQNPDIDVSVQVTPFDQYFTKLQTAIGGGAGPDVFWLNAPNLALYASNDAVLALDERVEKGDVDLSAFPDALVQLYTREDKLYAVPRDFDTIGLWYNKALFDAAGVEHPDENWTWDDVRQAAKKLTNREKGIYGITAWLTDQQGYYNTIAQAGGYVVSEDGKESGYDDPKTIQGLRFWTDLIKEGVSPTHQQMTDTAPKQMFQSGKSAMFYGGSWQAVSLAGTPAVAKNIDVAPLPKGEKDTSIIHGLGNAINAKSKNPDAAWELVKFLASKEAAEKIAESGAVIPAYDGTQQAWLDAFPQYNLQAFLDQVDNATPFPVSENTAEWQTLEKEMLPAAWTGQRPVEDVARELAAAMDKVLAKQ